MTTLYESLIQAGIEIDHHESDLYFPASSISRDLVIRCMAEGELKTPPEPFTSQLDGTPWLCAPFQYLPYWEIRSRAVRSPGDRLTQGPVRGCPDGR